MDIISVLLASANTYCTTIAEGSWNCVHSTWKSILYPLLYVQSLYGLHGTAVDGI